MNTSKANIEHGVIRVNPYTGDLVMHVGNGKWVAIPRTPTDHKSSPDEDPNTAYERAKKATQYR